MNHCLHPGCSWSASSTDPRYCWGHYIEHVLLMRPCPGAPKRVRLGLYVSTIPLRRRLDALIAQHVADGPTHIQRTLNGVALARGVRPAVLRRIYDRDELRWDVADRLACTLGVPIGSLYGHDWTAMDVEDAA